MTNYDLAIFDEYGQPAKNIPSHLGRPSSLGVSFVKKSKNKREQAFVLSREAKIETYER